MLITSMKPSRSGGRPAHIPGHVVIVLSCLAQAPIPAKLLLLLALVSVGPSCDSCLPTHPAKRRPGTCHTLQPQVAGEESKRGRLVQI